MTKISPSAIAIERSDNRKLSHDKSVSTTWASQYSCPSTCPFKNAGCYAEIHFAGNVTRRLNASEEKDPTKISMTEAAAIDTLTGKKPLRLHSVGDVSTIGGLFYLAAACERYIAKFGQSVYTYTHSWKMLPRGLWGRISVLASCQTMDDVKEALHLGYAAAMVVDKFQSKKAYALDSEFKGIPCPKQTGTAKDCKQCKLCWKSDKLFTAKRVILFESHGAQKFSVNRTLKALNEE